MRRIRTVFILDLTAIILPFLAMLIPEVAALSVLFILASAVLSVVALIMLREACKDLETERSWSTAAKRGAAQLKKSASYCLYMIVAPIPMALVLLIAAWIVAAAKDLNIYKLAYDVISGNFDAGYVRRRHGFEPHRLPYSRDRGIKYPPRVGGLFAARNAVAGGIPYAH